MLRGTRRLNLSSLRELGELQIIDIIERTLGATRRAEVGFGDDVSAVRTPGGRVVILKTDMLVGSTDVPPGMTLCQAARKAIVANVSDLAAKGTQPYVGLVALGLPSRLTRRDVQGIARGLGEGAKEYGFPLVGGDTNESNELVISIALFGLMARGRIVVRSGARIGDIVATTGDFGSASVALRAVLDRKVRPGKLPAELAQALYQPNAELRLGKRLVRTGALTASIDSSDGFAWSLHELSKMSRVGMRIDEVPISNTAEDFARKHGYDPTSLALYGGEEYHLIVTVKPSLLERARKAARGSLRPIGIVTRRSEGIRLLSGGKEIKIRMRGWEHFRH